MKIRDIVEGYTVLPPIDKEKYQARDGLEGPFRLKNSKVVYYDPREGKYYDPDTDMYIDYDDYRKMDEQNSKTGYGKPDRPGYVVKASDKPKTVKPNTGGSSKHPYQGKLVGEAEVGNTDYEFAHGKKPKGHGSWFFVAHRGGINFGKDVEGEDYIQLHQMSYGDAKKAAIKWAKSKGHTSLFVAT
jgi:hypothetical protein